MQQVQASTLPAIIGRAQCIEQLRSFCRGEISAVETYRQAIDATHEAWITVSLRLNLASHDDRVRLLGRQIEELGGEPPESSGAWGTFVRAAEGAAAAFGDKSALSLLEQGENHGLEDYRSGLANLDPESYRMVRDMILPQQVETHRTLADIKKQLA